MAHTLRPPGYRQLAFPEIDSTNAEAMRRAARGEAPLLWVRAGRQLKGRGRAGRSWSSPMGNFYASLLHRLSCPTDRLPQLSLVAAVAAYDAIASTAIEPSVRQELVVKWPNDIMFARRKAGGILIESSRALGIGGHTVALGFGINLVAAPPGLTDRPTASLAELGVRLEPGEMLERLSRSVSLWLGIWNGGQGFTTIRSAWLARSLSIGTAMSVKAGERTFKGTFAGVGEQGDLRLRTAGGKLLELSFGDVMVLGDGPEILATR